MDETLKNSTIEEILSELQLRSLSFSGLEYPPLVFHGPYEIKNNYKSYNIQIWPKYLIRAKYGTEIEKQIYRQFSNQTKFFIKESNNIIEFFNNCNIATELLNWQDELRTAKEVLGNEYNGHEVVYNLCNYILVELQKQATTIHEHIKHIKKIKQMTESNF